MKPQKIESSYLDLYLMLGPRFETLCLRRCNEGREGFEAFAMKNAQRALEKGFFPDNWLFYFRFTEEQLSRHALAFERNENYFRAILPSLRTHHMTPLHILPLERACLLYDRGRPLLETFRQFQTSKLRDFTPAGSNNAPEMLNARPPFNAYNVLSIDQGALLFSPSTRGLLKLHNLLQYMADHFFQSQGVLSTLSMNLLRLPAFQPALKKFVDKWPDDTAQALKELSSPDELFMRKNSVHTGIECHHYDMRPTLENFKAFATPTIHTGLSISRFNADLAHLLHIQKNGITEEKPFADETLNYTPIPSIDSIKEVMQEGQVTQRGIEGLQAGARSRAKELIEKLFPEYTKTLQYFHMKENMQLMDMQSKTRHETVDNIKTPLELAFEHSTHPRHKF